MSELASFSLVQLLNLANDGYDDGFLDQYFDTETGEPKQGQGSALARFIVRELAETFDRTADRSEQLHEARLCLSNAIEAIERVIEVLQ